MSLENLHCCDFQGGFFIDIDGKPWSDGTTVDEFWMTMSWFRALQTILRGEEVARAFPWEESALTLRRKGVELELEDIQHSGQVAIPKVYLPHSSVVRSAYHLASSTHHALRTIVIEPGTGK